MVRLTVKVRPQRGYTYPKAIKQVTVDSSIRLEELLANLKLDKKGTHLYSYSGVELPLNSSLATHNVQDGDTLETCSSPLLSAVLSTVISDLEAVQKIPDEERSRDRIQPLLDNCTFLNSDWTGTRWAFDHVKRRSICLKMLKQVLQRNGRFADLQVPQCKDLQSLYDFIISARVFNSQPNQHNTMEQCFKPSARNRNGQPSICWVLMQQKLDKFLRIASTASGDLMESFLSAQNERHGAMVATPTRRTTPNRQSGGGTVPRRIQRQLSLSNAEVQRVCTTCLTAPIDCMCLERACPFDKQPTCVTCFRANHPILTRNHERIMLTDARAKAVLRQTDRHYCPEYASGSFSILVTLYEAMHQGHGGRRQLSLTAKRLKELAQPRCRANLYDRQARGRTAFACVEKLTSEDLIRKEIIPGDSEETAKYSLMPKGEELAKFCFEYEAAIKSVVQNTKMMKDRKKALGVAISTDSVAIVVDNREDKTFADRLVNRCETDGIGYSRRDLPAGDYLYLTKKAGSEQEIVLPLVIERKTWSDLADSVTGRGRRRLDCVNLGGGNCDSRCQLCRMKKSQCSRIMFIIEGARCLSRDGQEDKCNTDKRCQYCKELQERHGNHINQAELERVIYRLQVEHQCLIHFTRSYNETINSLFILRDILGAGIKDGPQADDDLARAIALSVADSGVPPSNGIEFSLELTYTQFCANARSSCDLDSYTLPPRGNVVEWNDNDFVKNVFDGKAGECMAQLFGDGQRNSNRTQAVAAPLHVIDLSIAFAADRNVGSLDDSDEDDFVEVLDESQDSIQILEDNGWASAPPRTRPAKRPRIEHGVASSKKTPQTPPAKRSRIEDRASSSKRTRANLATQNANGQSSLVDVSKTALLLLTGLYECDQECYSDANKIWKNLYSEYRSEQTKFASLATFRLRQLQQSDKPFVKREAILFWVLFLQLRYGVIFHAVRQSSCALDLKTIWRGSQSTQQSARGVSNASPIVLSPPGEKKCIICYEKLSGENVEALPCGHCFHYTCIRKWWAISNARICPTCNYQVGGPKDDGTQQPQALRTRQVPRATASTPVTSNSDAQIREARLRRFGGGGGHSLARPPRVPNRPPTIDIAQGINGSWSCSKCTYANNSTSDHCVMCGDTCDGRNGQVASITSTHVAGVAARAEQHRWTCSECTLENDLSERTCDACGSAKPFHVDKDKVAQTSTNTPTVQTRVKRSSSAPTSSRKVKCGACSGFGHNRANYSAEICSAYYEEFEVQLRQKKKENEERKERDAERRIEELESAKANGNEQMQQVQLLLAQVQTNQEIQDSVTQSEVKRLQKAKARAQKRAQRMG